MVYPTTNPCTLVPPFRTLLRPNKKAPQLQFTCPTDLRQDGAPCSLGSLTGWSARVWIGTLPAMEGWGCRDVGPGEDGSTALLLSSSSLKIKTLVT